jgi:outer membrane protein assembly factor BamB
MKGPRIGPVALPALGLAGLLALSGCGTFLGEGETDKPLPGKRISILAVERGLSPDRAITDLEVTLPPPYVNDAWSQAGGTSAHAMYHLQLGDEPKRKWSSDVGEGSGDDRHILAQPLIVDGTVYTMDARSLITAFDSETGRRVWRTDIELDEEDGGYFGGGLAYEDGRLFVTTGFAIIFALDATSGEIIWQQRVTGPMRAAPAVSGGRHGRPGDRRPAGRREPGGGRLGGGRAVLLRRAARPPGGKWARAVERCPDAGEPLRPGVEPGPDQGNAGDRPGAGPGDQPCRTHGGDRSQAWRMVAIDLRRGVRAWELEAGGVQMPWSAGDFIYLLTTESEVVCVVRQSGRVRWVQALPRFEDPEELEGPIGWFGPVLAGDRLIVASSTGDAISISPYTGELLGRIALPGTPTVAPVVADNTLYVLTEDASLVAIR